MNMTVALGARSYEIAVNEPGGFISTVRAAVGAASYVIVTNTTLQKLYDVELRQWSTELQAPVCAIADGEQHKHLGVWSDVLDFLLRANLDRNAVVIAFGGGVVGDIAGFAAASFLRGVRYVQVPTTLLAMVDSSVGGKTGVNHETGKNRIGAFHQPSLVWVRTTYLDSLPEREYAAGYGEVFKYGFIGGADMAEFIRKNHFDIALRHPEALEEAVCRSIAIKADIVSRDEREGGVRALLNFGHTFGHALERYYQYRGLLHGEAVFVGMACAIEVSRRARLYAPADASWFDEMQTKLMRPSLPATPDIAKLYAAMFSDKKVRAGKLRLVLPVKPGVCEIRDDIAEETIMEAWESVCA
jgi:3-dehydroquinate synthase